MNPLTNEEQKKVLNYLPLVTNIAKYFFIKTDKRVPFEDLLSAGRFGLIIAVKKNENKYLDKQFTEYAKNYITQHIIEECCFLSNYNRKGKKQNIIDFVDFEFYLDDKEKKDIDTKIMIDIAVEKLNSKDQKIIKDVLKGLTLQEIGKKYNCTKQNVSKLRQKAEKSLRPFLENVGG